MRSPPRLYVYGVTVERWTRRHGVEPFSHPCFKCGRLLTTSIPFMQGRVPGLQAPTCECGNEQTPYAVVLDAAAFEPETSKTAARRKGAARRTRVEQQAKVTRLRVRSSRPRV